jgi:hypothetical protein
MVVASKAENLNEALSRNLKTAFLCHSHKDTALAEGVDKYFRRMGWSVYIDWKDLSMPEKPNEVTAKKIKNRILTTNYFLFLATENSMSSKWCPWEIGIADVSKGVDDIFIIPTSSGFSTFGNEYLGLYQKIDVGAQGNLAFWRPGEENGTRLANR